MRTKTIPTAVGVSLIFIGILTCLGAIACMQGYVQAATAAHYIPQSTTTVTMFYWTGAIFGVLEIIMGVMLLMWVSGDNVPPPQK